MEKYRFIFVVLVYRNCDDLIDFFRSVNEKCEDYRVIVVNSYYDSQTEEEIKRATLANNADFISVENKGYSYGNNQGIAHAIQNYEYEYVVVCNPDVLIKKWNPDGLKQDGLVYGPIIKTSIGKDQNPCFVKYLKLAEWISYKSYKIGIPYLDYVYFAFNRLLREKFLRRFYKSNNADMSVYGVHGAFIIFTNKFLEKNPNPFYEKMFLFNEERYIAWTLAQSGASAIFTKEIEIYHKEDGSMNKANVDIVKREKDSFVIYYEKIHGIESQK